MKKLLLLISLILLVSSCSTSNDQPIPLTVADILFTKNWYSSGGFQESLHRREYSPVYEYTFFELEFSYQALVYDGPCFDMRDFSVILTETGILRRVLSDTLLQIGRTTFNVASVDSHHIVLVNERLEEEVLNLYSTCERAFDNR